MNTEIKQAFKEYQIALKNAEDSTRESLEKLERIFRDLREEAQRLTINNN